MKKRLFSIFVVLCMVVTMIPAMSVAAASKTADKSWYVGHENDKEYTIGTTGQLLGFAELVNDKAVTFEGKTVKLKNNIDISGFLWEPISQIFAGTFNGDGHYITNINIDANQKYAGFFEGTAESAVIMNLSVSADDVINSKASSYAGAIVGYNKGKIYNCGMTGLVQNKGANGQAGGLVGQNAGSIVNCFSMGTVRSTCKTGGITATVEYKSNAKIINCYSTATLKGGIKGGIVGGTNSCEIEYCYYLGEKAQYGSGNISDNKNIYELVESQMKGTSRNNDDSTWIYIPLNPSYKEPLFTMLNEYVNKYNYLFDGILLNWEKPNTTTNIFLWYPVIAHGVRTSEQSSANYQCYYSDGFHLYNGYVYLYLAGENVGYYYIWYDNDKGYKIKDLTKGKWVGISSDYKEIVYLDEPYYWKSYNGGSFGIEVKTKNKGIKGLFVEYSYKYYYLGYGDDGFIVSEYEVIAAMGKESSDENHTLVYKDNKNGTHTSYCSKCGTIIKTGEHEYDQPGDYCKCGLYNPDKACISGVSVRTISSTSFKLRYFKNVTTYICEILCAENHVTAVTVKYSFDNVNWKEGTSFNNEIDPLKLYIQVTDSNGKTTKWEYTKGNESAVEIN